MILANIDICGILTEVGFLRQGGVVMLGSHFCLLMLVGSAFYSALFYLGFSHTDAGNLMHGVWTYLLIVSGLGVVNAFIFFTICALMEAFNLGDTRVN